MSKQDSAVYSVVIIGGGPAGLSAAVYNARADLQPLVLAGSTPGGQLTLTSEVENFPGFTHILGPELVQKIREQAIHFGTQIRDEDVTNVDFSKRPFTLKTNEGSTYRSHAVLIATGAKALWLGLESETKLRGRGVSACATCDGFFFRNKTVAVIGGGDTAMEDAMTLTKFATKVYVIHRRDSFRASKIMQERVLQNKKIEVVWNASVEEVLGEQKVEGIQLAIERNKEKMSKKIDLDGVFVAIGHKPDTQIFFNSIALNEKGYVLTSHIAALQAMQQPKKKDESFDYAFGHMTSVPGVFAAGDCVDYIYRQAATAAGMGVAASLEVERWLSEQDDTDSVMS